MKIQHMKDKKKEVKKVKVEPVVIPVKEIR